MARKRYSDEDCLKVLRLINRAGVVQFTRAQQISYVPEPAGSPKSDRAPDTGRRTLKPWCRAQGGICHCSQAPMRIWRLGALCQASSGLDLGYEAGADRLAALADRKTDAGFDTDGLVQLEADIRLVTRQDQLIFSNGDRSRYIAGAKEELRLVAGAKRCVTAAFLTAEHEDPC